MMKRRQFLAGFDARWRPLALARPALAQASPELKWRLTSSFPNTFDIIQESAKVFASAVAAATDGRFQIEVFASGEIKPGLQALEAVQKGEIEMAHTALNLFATHEPALAFATGVPFGLNARQQAAWWTEGGGQELIAEVLRPFGVVALSCGNTGAQMGGWFRKEVKTPADFNGLKMRIGGLSGRVLEKLGGIAGGDAGRRDQIGARERRARCRAMGRARMTTSASAFRRSRPLIIFPAGSKARTRFTSWSTRAGRVLRRAAVLGVAAGAGEAAARLHHEGAGDLSV